jgi:hypothetical protein
MRRFQWCVLALLPLVAAAVAGQERTLPMPSNVAVDGVPPIPMSLVEAVAPYGQFRQARLVAWHPVERRMVIATTFGNVPQLHHVRFPGGARTQLTFFGDGVAAHPGAVFASTGDSIVFQKDTAWRRRGEPVVSLRLCDRPDRAADRWQVSQRRSGRLARRAHRLPTASPCGTFDSRMPATSS